VSSDWLILGVGSMYRVEKQSQTPTLFDSLDENITKSSTSESISVEKNNTASPLIQHKTTPVQEQPVQTQVESQHPTFLPLAEPSTKSVRKIIVYYTDNTFQEFMS